MKKLTLGMGIVLALGLMGCGGDDDEGGVGGGKAGTVNESVAKQAGTSNVTTSTTLVGAADASAGETAANNFFSNALAAQGAVTPNFSASLSRLMHGGMAQDGCACEGTSCTFTDCGETNEQGTFKINGTLDWTGGNVQADLDYFFEQTGANASTTEVSFTADLTVSTTEISGSTGSNGSIETAAAAQAGVIKFANEITYNAVTLANGQPTGGSIDFAGSYTIAGQKYSSDSTITYP